MEEKQQSARKLSYAEAAQRVTRAAVIIPHWVDEPVSVTNAWGSGGTLRVTRPDGSQVTYIVTNSHVISDNIQRTPSAPPSRHLFGANVGGEFFYGVFDSGGQMGLARLVSYNSTGNCNGTPSVTPGMDYVDQAVLEVLDPRREPFLFERVWRAVDPQGYAQRNHERDPRQFNPRSYDFDQVHQQAFRDSGRFIAAGFPGDKSGTPEVVTGHYDHLRYDASGKEIKRFFGGRLRNDQSLSFDPDGGRLRNGHSGSFIVDRETMLPIGVKVLFADGEKNAAGEYSTAPKAWSTPIRISVEKIREIEVVRQQSAYVTVTDTLPACKETDIGWHDTTLPAAFRPEDVAYQARLQAAARQFAKGAQGMLSFDEEERKRPKAPIAMGKPRNTSLAVKP